MRRTVSGITYELTYKRVKNINLRVGADSVAVSAPRRVSAAEVDAFIERRSEWIYRARERAGKRPIGSPVCAVSDEECLNLLKAVSDSVFPLFLGAICSRPEIRVREMKSRWGVCHFAKNLIVLNKRLYNMPLPAIEYVIAHEYTHMLHHDHQAGFHALMRAVMPDYSERRKLLR